MKAKRFGKNLMVAVKIIAAVLMCVYMWGCGDDVSMRWSEERSLGGVVGFVDDSLVIVSTSRYWHEEVEPTFGLSYDRSGYAHPGLSLYNYRVQLDGPVWSDTLDNSRDDDFNYIRGQLSDSVIWGGDPKSEVSFWKIGGKPQKMKIKKLFDGCSVEVRYTTKLRPWLDGKILVMGERSVPPDVKGFDMDSLGNEYCQYGVLDTMRRTITYKKLEDDLKWIKKCDDVRAWDDNVYCFMPGEHAFEAVLLRNGIDTIDVPIKFSVGDFWGNVLRPNANLCDLVNSKVVCSGAIWRGGLSFYQNEEIVVDLE
ncbi:hypothetical protein [Fibrobacter sp.]|uniref:hypothetical protein n=1 Tax=Fibrobacter sp. TaxID=35828 RepID=UPI0026255658|nr:hypothetical protein [Fibrobacter sp.]MDD5942655.1 hypothetical protein [Fibrobacter sp.]